MKTSASPTPLEVRHNLPASRFEIQAGEHLAVLEYQLDNDNIVFTHTLVPAALEGQGIGSQLAKAGLDYAKDNLYRVIPLCPFVEAYIRRHAEYQPLVRT